MKYPDRLGRVSLPPDIQRLLLAQMLSPQPGQFGLGGPQIGPASLAGRMPAPAMPSNASLFGQIAGVRPLPPPPAPADQPIPRPVQDSIVARGRDIPMPPGRPPNGILNPSPDGQPQGLLSYAPQTASPMPAAFQPQQPSPGMPPLPPQRPPEFTPGPPMMPDQARDAADILAVARSGQQFPGGLLGGAPDAATTSYDSSGPDYSLWQRLQIPFISGFFG